MAVHPDRTHYSRRSFLAMGGALGGSALASPVFAAIEQTEKALSVSKLAWIELNKALQGNLLRYGDTGFDRLSQPNNLVYKKNLPVAVAVCRNSMDVSICLKWCASNGVHPTIRGGGHSYAGFSSTTGLLIDIQGLNAITFNPDRETVTVGGGAKNIDIYDKIVTINRSITHGRCLGVGIGGFLLGGGVGFDMRQYGLGCDRLQQTQLVLASGELIDANAQVNPDLLWACKGGGGGNFGVNTSFELNVFPVPDHVMFKLNWEGVSDDFLATLFKTLQQAPRGLGDQVYLQPGQSKSANDSAMNVYFFGHYQGSTQEFMDIIAPIMSRQTPSKQDIRLLPYLETERLLSDAGLPGYYRYRSRFIHGDIPAEMISLIRQWLSKWNAKFGSGFVKFYHLGGAVNDVKPSDTAFVHRKSDWMIDISLLWQADLSTQALQQAHDWQDTLYQPITQLAGGGVYQNFPDLSLNDWATDYYGTNLSRLRAVKKAVDPDNFFKFSQSIQPA
jgi:FAD/FMN-containing dehydrogenase